MSKHYYPGKNILEGVKLDLYTEDSLRSIDYATMEVLQTQVFRYLMTRLCRSLKMQDVK